MFLLRFLLCALNVKKTDGGEMRTENNYSSTVTAIRSADKKRRGSCRHVDVGGCRRDVISLVFIPAQNDVLGGTCEGDKYWAEGRLASATCDDE